MTSYAQRVRSEDRKPILTSRMKSETEQKSPNPKSQTPDIKKSLSYVAIYNRTPKANRLSSIPDPPPYVEPQFKPKTKHTFLKRKSTDSTSIETPIPIVSTPEPTETAFFKRAPPSRKISRNVTDQWYLDCVSHTLARMLTKLFRKRYPETFEYNTEEEQCIDLYLDSRQFYDCDATSCAQRMTLADMKARCGNPQEINSVVLYMHFYSLCTEKFGCNGIYTEEAFNYILYGILYNSKKCTKCNLLPELCDIIRPALVQFNSELTDLSRPLVKLFKLKYDSSDFWEKLKETIDNNLYLYYDFPYELLYLKRSGSVINANSIRSVPSKMHHATTVVHCELDYEGGDHSFTIKNSGGDKHTFIDVKKSELDLYFKLHSEVKSMKDFLKFDECDATHENQELILAKVAAYVDKTDGGNRSKKKKRRKTKRRPIR